MSLSMVRASLDTRHLVRLARRQRQESVDLGYAVHATFCNLFGELAPKPFVLTSTLGMGAISGRRISVLGYTQGTDLAQRARELADPDHHSAVDWSSFASKEMPTAFASGRRLGFEVRVCPTVRKASDGPRHRKGSEVDAFVSAAWEVDGADPVSRAGVYEQWLTRRLAPAADLEEVTMTRFVLAPAFRRGRSRGPHRRGHSRRRPDATLRGVLRVTDATAFQQLLARGVGRHRAFGFGMLLLRAA